MGRYDPASGKTVKWNVAAIDVDLDIKKVSQAGYYDIFGLVDQDEIILTSLHHNLCFEVAWAAGLLPHKNFE
jgi:hypothetical protein